MGNENPCKKPVVGWRALAPTATVTTTGKARVRRHQTLQAIEKGKKNLLSVIKSGKVEMYFLTAEGLLLRKAWQHTEDLLQGRQDEDLSNPEDGK